MLFESHFKKIDILNLCQYWSRILMHVVRLNQIQFYHNLNLKTEFYQIKFSILHFLKTLSEFCHIQMG